MKAAPRPLVVLAMVVTTAVFAAEDERAREFGITAYLTPCSDEQVFVGSTGATF